MTGSHIRNLDVLIAIKMPAMFNRIQQHLAKGGGDIFLLGFWQVDHFMKELQQPFCSSLVAASGEPDPCWIG